MATAFDLFGIGLIIFMSVSGLKKGLVNGVLKMVGVYAAMYTSMNYGNYGAVILEPFISIPESYKTVVGFIVIFLATMYSISFFAYLIRKLISTMNLGIVDRVGGITFGAVKAGLILSAFVWAFAMVPADMRGTWQKESQLYPFVEVFAANMVSIFSLEDELDQLQSTVGSMMGKGKNQLMEQALGGVGGIDMEAITKIGGAGTLSADGHSIIPDGDDLLGGSGDIMNNPMLKKAMESLGGPQREIIEKAVEALQSGDASSLMEGAINSKDASGNSLMQEAMKYMDPDQKVDMNDLIRQMEAELLNPSQATTDEFP